MQEPGGHHTIGVNRGLRYIFQVEYCSQCYIANVRGDCDANYICPTNLDSNSRNGLPVTLVVRELAE